MLLSKVQKPFSKPQNREEQNFEFKVCKTKKGDNNLYLRVKHFSRNYHSQELKPVPAKFYTIVAIESKTNFINRKVNTRKQINRDRFGKASTSRIVEK